MRSSIARAFVVGLVIVWASGAIGASPRLAIKVTPQVIAAPASIAVTATVERDPENRVLEISADSGGFYRSSAVQLEGAEAPRVTQVWLKGLPGGEYDVVAVLRDARGRSVIARTHVMVVSRLGEP